MSGDASERLADAVRGLIETMAECESPPASLEVATLSVTAVNDALRSVSSARPRSRNVPSTHADPWPYFHLSPISGLSNPLAPPMRFEVRDQTVYATCVFNLAYQGPPGYVHGAFVAAAFDELLGIANAVSGNPAMTGKLEIRYLRPTPIGLPLELVARNTGKAGRRVLASGTIAHQGVVTAEAEGVFVEISPARAAELFPEQVREA
jgi:acyl-coenzyme A thioesterase PaaI-like protein